MASFRATPDEIRSIGPGRKEYSDPFFTYVVEGDGFSLRFVEYRNKVCVAKVVGKRTVPAVTIPEKLIAAETVPEHEEDVIEWECPGSILAPKAVTLG